MPQEESAYSKSVAVIVFTAVFAVAAVYIAYEYYRGPIHAAMLTTTALALDWLSWLPFHQEKIANASNKIHVLALGSPEKLAPMTVLAVCGFALRYYSLTLVVPAILLPIYIYRVNPIDKYIRQFALKSFIKQASLSHPHLLPIANRNLDNEDLNEGPWRVAERPEQWATKHKLLVYGSKKKAVPYKRVVNKEGLPWIDSPILEDGGNKDIRFNRKKATQLLSKQLGMAIPPKKSLPDFLPDYMFVLVASFVAFGLGDRDKCYEILDSVSLEFNEKKALSRTASVPYHFADIGLSKPIINEANKVFKRLKESQNITRVLTAHMSFTNPLIVAFKRFAQQKGSLNTAQFIWLRPINRPLFYAINQEGGREAWLEASGVWNHMLVEDMLKKTVTQPQVDQAIGGIITHLQEDGWLPTKEDEGGAS